MAFVHGQQLTAISDDSNNKRMRTKKRIRCQKILDTFVNKNLFFLKKYVELNKSIIIPKSDIKRMNNQFV